SVASIGEEPESGAASPREARVLVVLHEREKLVDRVHLWPRFVAVPLEISSLPEHAPMLMRPYISRLGNGKLGHLSWLPMPLRTHLEEQHTLTLDAVGHVDLITDRKG